MSTVGPIAGQGVISTQVQLAQHEAPVAAQQQRQVESAPPVPPPSDSGRGTNLDASA